MRRTNSKKLQLRRQNVARMDRPDPITELRQLKEEQLKQVAGGMMEDGVTSCPQCCC